MVPLDRLADWLRTKISRPPPSGSLPAALVGGRARRVPRDLPPAHPFPAPRQPADSWLRAGLHTLSDTRIAVRRQASAPRRWPRSYEAAWSGGRGFHRDRVAELL